MKRNFACGRRARAPCPPTRLVPPHPHVQCLPLRRRLWGRWRCRRLGAVCARRVRRCASTGRPVWLCCCASQGGGARRARGAAPRPLEA
eukprot:6180819-Pleurochrysis_carterae.AAC.1